MSSLILSAAPIDFENNNNNNINHKKQNFSHNNNRNKTSKNRDKKIDSSMIRGIYTDEHDDGNNETSNLGNYKPVQSELLEKNLHENNSSDLPVTNTNSFSNLNSNYANDYYKQYTQNMNYDSQHQYSGINHDSNSELLKKLDNILHILEEQQEEKVSYITEELILYIFLGVFVIYVLDSFVRVGKYSR